MIEVVLPSNEIVQVPEIIDPDVWFLHEMHGYVNPAVLAPYPQQPRMYIDPDHLEELEASVAAQGVRDPVLVTPVCYAPWAGLEKDDTRPFLIVSGHRRTESALKAGLTAVPIKIRIYKNESDFDDDAETLNDHRENLSEIEEGWTYRRRLARGEKLTHVRDKTGRAYQWLQGRINLTYLCPTIQELISPMLKPRQRLAIGFAAALGGLKLKEDIDLAERLEELGDNEHLPDDLDEDEKRFRLQRAYLNYCEKQGWKGVESENFVKTGKIPEKAKSKTAGHHNSPSGHGVPQEAGYKMPSHLRMRVLDWFKFLGEMGILDLRQSDIDLAFSNVMRQDLEAMADRLDLVSTVLRQTAKKKRPSSDDGPTTLERKILNDY